ncbi:glycoside hydrolase family 31 protein [Bacillus taeanensis]|uniref:Alpha-glucosidase n=1 Tax=Bacillus taeanensis TaxID=273032 RepID=A0A366XVZ2_9BACI|nr:TIM-barrel domain-containing protein [Bacillus taeanensis]RBW68304.1 alpha-glucosidase [Bacillus taeanensis]
MKLSKKSLRVLASVSLATAIGFTAEAPNVLAAVTQPEPDTPLVKENLQHLSVQGVEKLSNGVKLDLGTNEAYIRLFDKDLVKVSVVKKGEKEFESRGIAKKASEWDTPIFSANGSADKYTLKTDEITVEIKMKPFGVRFLDKKGNVINEDYVNQGKTSGYENGKPYVFKKTDKDEDFYGFGEQAGLELNKRGDSIGLWNTDAYAYDKDTKYLYTAIPFFIGLKDEKAYGIFFDNTHRSYYEMASESDDYYYFYANGGQLTYYFAYGPEIGDVIDRYTDLTGKMDVPAKWSLGLHQSKWGYTADEILNVAKTYRDKEIPLDTMHFDIDYMDGYRVSTWNEEYKQALKDLKAMSGFHAIAINDPAVKQDENYFMYQEGTKNDYWGKNPDGTPFVGPVWPGDSMFPDFSKQEVRDWWAKNHDVLLNEGIDGIWNDMNEPAVFLDDDRHRHTMPLDTYFGTEDNKIMHTEYHNLYGHDEADATYQAFKMHKPGTRPFVLTRDMYAGTQRWAALWTGDNVSNWEHLAMSLPMNMNVGMSGVSFVGNDIGGFASRPDAELFARWIEVGAFLPFSRIHYDSDAKAEVKQGQEPWAFGPEVEKISKKYIEMRYKLLPYLYNEFKESADSGKPVQQPLVYQFQNDENTYDISDQYMFGDSMMLAPVVTKGQTSRNVYLPEGVNWTDYWTGKQYSGGQTITVDAPLGHLPIFVKDGSIIPTREVQQYTDEKPLTNLVLDTYLDKNASYNFYEDDGATEDYKQGEYNLTEFDVTRKPNAITFKQKQQAYSYQDSKLHQYTLKLNNVEKPSRIQAGNNKYQEVGSLEETQGQTNTFFYDENTKVLYVSIPADEKKEVQIR